tara:strand:- start:372 stop:1145 length:774 start_codon:yes stop_codon:yes gene_type:complete
MIKIDIKSELPTAIKWTNEHTKQLPFSTAQALNSIVAGSKFLPGSKDKSIVAALSKASKKAFEQPKKFTTEAWRLGKKANKRSLAAQLKPKSAKKKGSDREPYLRPQIKGGSRGVKPFEAKLATHPLSNLPAGSRLVPVADNFEKPLEIDKYGNVTRKSIDHIFNNVSTKGNRTFLIGKPQHGNRPPGVYWRRRENEQLWKIFEAVPSATYRPRLRVEQIAQQTVIKEFGHQLRFWLAKNVRQSKLKGKADLRTGIF